MKFLHVLSACILLFAACTKEVEQPEQPTTQETPPLTTDSISIQLSANPSLLDSFELKYSGEWNIIVSEDAEWLELSSVSGMGNKKIFLKALSLNTSTSPRTAQLTITPSDVNAQSSVLDVTQEPYNFSTWSKHYGGTLEDNFVALLACGDGGYLAAGTAATADGDISFNHGKTDAWFVKVDVAGNILWEKTYGGAEDEMVTHVSRSDNGFIVLASSASSGMTGYWIFEIDEEGNLLWQKSYNQPWNLESMVQVPLGGFLLTGRKDNNALLFKISAGGDSLWQKTYGGPKFDRFGAVIPTADGGFIAAGNRDYQPLDNNTATGEFNDIYLVKTDAEGVLQYEKQYGGNNMDLFSEMIPTSDGGYLVTGMTTSTNLPGYHGEYDVYVLKLDANTNVSWQKAIGGSLSEGMSGIAETADGGFIVAANAGSIDGDVTEHSSNSWVVRLSSSGQILWNESREQNINSIGPVVNLGEGRYMVAGGVQAGNHGSSDAWLFTLED